AGRAWAVPMLDTHIHTQLFPIYNSYDAHINRVDTDRLHPNVKGHHHIALSVQGYLEHTIPLK
ncbi:MAG: SGNH/GDSL hydrolase family protein, partial [Bacteroidaceae bacterium]|nr:SGNH/GDSL hydrolase family protein [Bacteroidaceae bacterium]